MHYTYALWITNHISAPNQLVEHPTNMCKVISSNATQDYRVLFPNSSTPKTSQPTSDQIYSFIGGQNSTSKHHLTTPWRI